MKHHRWTLDDIEQAQALRARGMKFEDIGREMGLSRDSVRRALAKRAPGVTTERESSETLHRINAKTGSEDLRVAAVSAIMRYANDNGICVDQAARRLLSEAR